MVILTGGCFDVAIGATVLDGGGTGLSEKLSENPLLAPSGFNMQGTDNTTTTALMGGVINPSPLYFLRSQDCLYVGC